MELLEHYVELIKMHNRPWSDFEKSVFTLILILTMVFCVYGIIKKKLTCIQAIAIVCFVICICFLYATTIFTRSSFDVRQFRCKLRLDWYLFISGNQHERDEISLNIILFMPFGLLWPLMRKNKRGLIEVFIIGLLISLSVETIQYFSRRGVFDIEDLITNVIGALIGGICIKLIFYIGRKIWLS